jgi:dephospho-CoA kinase
VSRYVVGLTGGVGSGKSTVADFFVELGAALVDTDAIAHELTGPKGAAIPALIAAFGPAVLNAAGALDRARMRQRVFADAKAREILEGILHPMIRELSAQRTQSANAPYVILAVPLLVESVSYRERCDRILVVDCPETQQIERVMARNGLSEAEVKAIMAAQATRAQRLAVADDVVSNETDLASLKTQVLSLHQKYLQYLVQKPNANC